MLALQYAQPVVIVHESDFDRLVRQTHDLTERVDRENARINAAKHARRAARSPSRQSRSRQNASGQAVSVADEIGKLAVLRQRGLLTPTEFNAAKAKLLKR